MNRKLPLFILVLAGMLGVLSLLLNRGLSVCSDATEDSSTRSSPSQVPLISEESALLAARRHVEGELPLEEYDSSVSIRDGDFYVTFRTKKPAMGGAVRVWVDGENGRIVKSFWYQ